MLWMETYFFCCSVRLGVMVISILSFEKQMTVEITSEFTLHLLTVYLISFFIQSVIFFAMGLSILNPILELFNEDKHFRKYAVVKMLTDMVKHDSNSLKVLLQFYFFVHMAASGLAFYGSLKLKKYFLLPIIFLGFWRVILYFTIHVIIMRLSKNYVDLGILITNTLVGGFFILFLGYNWTACVALYQIINLINSERYKSLYGDDPFKPLIPKTYNHMITQHVRVLITPTNHDVNRKKTQNANNQNHLEQPIISVLPVNYFENNSKPYRNNTKWPTTTTTTTTNVVQLPSLNGNLMEKMHKQNDNYDINYNYWQWSEIAPAISVRNTKNIYPKWNYY